MDAAWQLAAIAPLNELDQLRLLRSATLPGLFNELEDLATAAATAIADSAFADDEDDDGDEDDDRL